MDEIDFDAAASAVEAAYLTADIVEQRRRVCQAVDAEPGSSVLDIGSGPGLLVRDLAAMVGAEGRVCGIDRSEGMIAMAKRRCADLPWVELEPADAAELPYPDATFDAVVSTQVYEYVADMAAALDELARVLKPGGRAVILDTDYDSLVLSTDDTDRLARILEAWDEHFVHADLPRKLRPLLRAAGLEVRDCAVVPVLNTEYGPESFSYHLTALMADFAAGRAGVTPDEARDWIRELERLGSEGRYFYSLNRYLFVADKRAG
jgi:arsenite methyltransferase